MLGTLLLFTKHKINRYVGVFVVKFGFVYHVDQQQQLEIYFDGDLREAGKFAEEDSRCVEYTLVDFRFSRFVSAVVDLDAKLE